MTTTIQVRDVSDEAVAVLRVRAAAAGMSLTMYLRRHLEQIASAPSMAELLERADRRRARGVSVSTDAVLTALRAARDERG
ncbi:MAG: FitA-like ribbon-helix-helix domain-containing protein [Micromonosporaceae bacterium]